MFQIASVTGVRKDRWLGQISDELNLAFFIAASYQKLQVSQRLNVRALTQDENRGSVTNALGKEPINCANSTLAKAAGCRDDLCGY